MSGRIENPDELRIVCMITDHSSIQRRFVDWLMIRLSTNILVDGLWVGVFSEKQGKEILGRLYDALQLIKSHDPYRYRRVLKEIRRIWAFLLPGNDAVWLSDLKRCVVDPRFILAARIEFIASAIVHEATHGRLTRCGVAYSEALRGRVEMICMRQELAFASRLPDGGELQNELKSRLASGAYPVAFWTDKAFKERHEAGEIEMVRFAGVPEWLFRLTVWIRRRKRRRR